MAVRQSTAGVGGSISAATASTMPSRISSFAVDVVVQRGCLDAQFACESAHGDGLDALAVCHGKRDAECPLEVHRGPVRHLGWSTAHGVPPLACLLGRSLHLS